jgi:hypothetical protein
MKTRAVNSGLWNRNVIGKILHGGKIPSVRIGKRLEKIPVWWEKISLSGRKKVFRCMEHLVYCGTPRIGWDLPTPYLSV